MHNYISTFDKHSTDITQVMSFLKITVDQNLLSQKTADLSTNRPIFHEIS